MNKQATKTITILSRDVIARTGVILYTILSSNGVDKYFATVQDGQVTAHDCPGYINCGHCYHADYIEQAELVASFDIQSAADEIVEAVGACDPLLSFEEIGNVIRRAAQEAEEIAPAGIEKFFKPAPTYGVCGHLSRNPDDECPACRSRWYR